MRAGCLTVAVTAFLAPVVASAQAVNWTALDLGARHLITATAGIEYGAVLGVGYAYRHRSLLVGGEWTAPAGGRPLDDFRGRVGVQLVVARRGGFAVAGQVHGIVRRYDNPYGRLVNLGADAGATVGWYGRRWFLAADVGLDEAVATHIRNSDLLRESYPAARDGWYRASGGNVHYGLLAGRSLGRVDAHLALGGIVEHDFRARPTVPIYLRVGTTLRVGGAR